ncbi:MAG: ABC transporter permease, partial [Bacteroidota bacterium]|nr:ABC transporter permease [Bacteroidota bacterium]MDX5429511.1 ABC transporter permease [Bacteroidota bacterium]MDX5468296.1 ABC transporter permease [Bacteroidota bacterium]
MLLFYHFGRYLVFLGNMFSKPEKLGIYISRTFQEMVSIGINSLPIVAIIALFSGGVSTIQTSYQLIATWISKTIIGSIVSDTVILEFAPTITCLVLSGKVGSSIASEIGTMKVSEQVDALEVMGINSIGYLALPKILAGVITVPLLIVVAMFLGIWGGMMAGVATGILPIEMFMEGARSSFKTFNVVFALIKATSFGFIITSISSFQGYYT